MTRSADRLRSASGGEVTVTITRGDLLAGVLALAKATGSQEVVVVTDADSYPHQTMPEWRQRAAAYLKVPHVHVVEHHG